MNKSHLSHTDGVNGSEQKKVWSSAANKDGRILAHEEKRNAKAWDHILSRESSSRKPSIMQALHTTLSKPGVLSLGPGAPSSEYYPFEEIRFRSPEIGTFNESEIKGSSCSMLIGKYDAREGKGIYDLSQALNYGQGTGSPQLLSFVTEHTQIVHDPPYWNWKCILTGGNTSALDLAFRMFTERGDIVLVEEYVYPTASETATPLGVSLIGLKIDTEGILPQEMNDTLENWDLTHPGVKKPHLLYTVPTGQNPTGATPHRQRRMDIYRVAQKHDIYIIEDDPYYFIQMLPEPALKNKTPPSQDEFVASLIPSYLALDTDGRVMRLDSFSKIIVPGARTGWITASEQIAERWVRAHETSLQNPSGFSQIMLYKLLREAWGHSGFFNWLYYLQVEYTKRRNNILAACNLNLPTSIVKVDIPKAGFFVWLQVSTSKYPRVCDLTTREIEKRIYDATVKEGVLVVPGSWFQADQRVEPEDIFFRLTFVSLSLEDTAEAVRRFSVAIRTCFEMDPPVECM